MSLTVTSAPFLLLSGLLTTMVETQRKLNNDTKEFEKLNNKLSELMKNDTITEEMVEEITKEYTTVFMDKDVLLKTLSEHGAQNIEVLEDNIICTLDCFAIEFMKKNDENNNAYIMKLRANCNQDRVKELLDDINAEYAMNTQEETYIKLKERLDKQGLQIDEEEVLEDNSIMLTINID